MHTFVNRYFALMAPNISPAAMVNHVLICSGLIACASVSIMKLLKDSTIAPLYQTREASNLRVRVEVFNRACQCNTADCESWLTRLIRLLVSEGLGDFFFKLF